MQAQNNKKSFSLFSYQINFKLMFLSLCECDECNQTQASTATNQSHAISTWPPLGAQETVANTDRPHTISSAYERGHQRPALTVYTFQNPDQNINEISNSNSNISNGSSTSAQKSPASVANRPPLPIVMI